MLEKLKKFHLKFEVEDKKASCFWLKAWKFEKICCPILTSIMSGSPIIQNGKLVGAVTHVLLKEPCKGYGISIETMLNAAG